MMRRITDLSYHRQIYFRRSNAAKKYFYFLPLVLTLQILLGILTGCRSTDQTLHQTQSLILASAENPTGFQKALPPAKITFPEDFGPHPDFQTEWWYYTGNLDTAEGRHFGYQLTFFRRALIPQTERVERNSNWGADQVYLAHFAITDVQAGTHTVFEKSARGALGLAGAQAEPYQVWLEDWSIRKISDRHYALIARQDDYALELQMVDTKGPVLQGKNGYSQKGPDPGNASYYYSQTHLETEGKITVMGLEYTVSGLSWKDHEYSTSALSGDQVGWDWFALQLDDGTEVKVYHIRKADGSIDNYSSGGYISAEGTLTPLTNGSFEIIPQSTWTSPVSGAEYPSGWLIQVPDLDISLQITPYLANQELNVSYSYWEGAVRVQGTKAGHRIGGSGYAELTGYAQSMAGEF
jgi:predicted secreted hydrolase